MIVSKDRDILREIEINVNNTGLRSRIRYLTVQVLSRLITSVIVFGTSTVRYGGRFVWCYQDIFKTVHSILAKFELTVWTRAICRTGW